MLSGGFMSHFIAKEIKKILHEINSERELQMKDPIPISFLALEAGVIPAGLESFLKGKTNMQLKSIEKVLEVLNYEIDLHPIEKKSRLVDCEYRRRRRA